MTKKSIASRRRRAGFSLVEMIGVLAIIAILAVVIVPKVFSTIASSRITSTIGSVTTMKSAVSDFAAKYGTIPITGNTFGRLDDLLSQEGFLESRFAVKLGNQPTGAPAVGATWSRNPTTGVWAHNNGGTNQNTQSRLICIARAAAQPANPNGTWYTLDGLNPLPAGSNIVSAVLVGVTPNEARELSLRVDGEALSEAATNTPDTRGKVTYTGAGATRTVYVYVAHQ